jgi:hypothetical protein
MFGPDVADNKELSPIAIEPLDVEVELNAASPIPMLLFPVVFPPKLLDPTPTFFTPELVKKSAADPIAMFLLLVPELVAFERAFCPNATLVLESLADKVVLIIVFILYDRFNSFLKHFLLLNNKDTPK